MGAKKILINNVTVGTLRFFAGTELDATTDAADLTKIVAAGGVVFPKENAAVAAAALVARGMKVRGGAVDEDELASLMQSAAVQGAMVQFVDITLVAGTLTVNTDITITANSKVIPYLRVPGAGVSGTRYAITGITVGVPGTGAFTVTAKDSAAGNNTVATDVSQLTCVIIG